MPMKPNVGSTEKIIRLLAGLVLLALYFFSVIPGVWGTVSLIVGALLLITGLVNYCPLWTVFKINTVEKKKEE